MNVSKEGFVIPSSNPDPVQSLTKAKGKALETAFGHVIHQSQSRKLYQLYKLLVLLMAWKIGT